MGMFLIEYLRGSTELSDYYQILNQVEQRLEVAMEMPFNRIPIGRSSGVLIDNPFSMDLDLRPAEIAQNEVHYSLTVDMMPIEFSALKDSFSGQLQRARVEEGMKRLEIVAEWGDKKQHNIRLIAYRANL
jgi:hypothetical protein